jgi:serine/threonine protein kinase
MNDATPCPDVHALRAYAEGAGGLDAGAAAALEAHLASCSYCRGRAEGLVATRRVAVPGDTGWPAPAADPTDPAPPSGEVTITVAQERDDDGPAGSDPDRSATALDAGDGEGDEDSLAYLLPPARPDTLGRIGDYDVLGVLGRGGMGVVLKAYDATLNRVVAIKVLAPALAGRPGSRRQFLAEARAAAAINHPNVVTIHDVKTQRGMPYLVMEYLGGQTLRQRIGEGPRLRPLEIVRVAVQVARGLAAAHEQGVIHRDIKPGNVMLEGDLDRIKITDFGLARAALDATEPAGFEKVVGTPAYIPPEVVHGGAVHERSDLFSLGCVIYAMVAGHSPFHGAKASDVLHRVVALDPPPLHALDPAVPRPLSLLVGQLLEKDPDRRPPSAAAVAAVLNDLLASLQLRGDRSSWSTDSLELPSFQPFATPPPPSRPLRTIAEGAAAVLLLALLLGLGVQWLDRRDRLGLGVNLGLVDAGADARADGDGAGPDGAGPAGKAARAVLTVGPSPAADYRTLAAALAAVDRPGTVLRLERGVHEGPVRIGGRPQLERLTIEPDGPLPRDAVVLGGDAAGDAVVTVADVADVTLRRLTFDAPPDGFALAVKGSTPGLVVEDAAFRKRPGDGRRAPWSHAWLGEGARGAPDAPIAFRRCAFAPWEAGLVLQGDAGAGIAHVEVDACRFDGGTRDVELIGRVAHVRVHGCLFVGGRHGVFLRDLAPPSDALAIDHNTFFRTACWIGLEDTAGISADAAPHDVTIADNALLEATAFDLAGAPLARSRDAGDWTMTRNRAEGPEDAVGHALVERAPTLDVQSRDPSHPGFLRPVPGSALIDPDAGPPGYLGALAPARNAVVTTP